MALFSDIFFESSEIAHADGEVVVFEDLLTEDVFEDVFEGEKARDGAEFVDCSGELLVFFDEGLEGIGGGGGFWDKGDGMHEGADGGVLFGIDHVFASDNSDDVIDVVFVDGEAGEGDGGVDFEDLVKGEALVEGGDNLAGGFELGDGDIVEGECVGDHVAFIIGEGAFLGAFFGEEDDLVVVIFLRLFDGVDEEVDDFFADEGEWAHEEADDVHGVDEGFKKYASVEEADIFWEDF